MPAFTVENQEPFLKTTFLAAMDKIGNSASVEELRQIADALRSGTDFGALLEASTRGDHEVSAKEIKHVRKDWFDNKTSWWRRYSPERVMREGLLDVIRIQTAHRRTPLPVDYWWLPNAKKFAVIPLQGPSQVTIFITTPPRPTRAASPRGSARKKAAKKKAARKARR